MEGAPAKALTFLTRQQSKYPRLYSAVLARSDQQKLFRYDYTTHNFHTLPTLSSCQHGSLRL